MMKTIRLPFTILALTGVWVLGYCAAPIAEEALEPADEATIPVVAEVEETPFAEEEIPFAEEETPFEETAVAKEEAVEDKKVVSEKPSEKPGLIPVRASRDVERVPPEILHPDSAAYVYMIRRDDYLGKIALEEYGNPNEWRRIYAWNRDRIGDDPNIIYPYNELDLYKPEDEAPQWSYDYTTHDVEEGESLWTIAGREYGDELAWIIIFWDNEEILNSNSGQITPGMELRIRSQLWPSY